MKKDRTKDLLLEQLRRIPIVQVAAEKVGVSRATVYRWKTEDEKFQKALEEALAEGEALINDLSESQLLSLIKDKNWPAISFWLRHRNPKFKDRVEVEATVRDLSLSPAQQEIVRKALELSNLTTGDLPNES
ncbi:MAG: phBC6A51 family helix-turn-helix protein [Parcubacteria group bacterium]